ncbi:hypothetical protein [Streptomyces daliensis]|uniref:Uncharacterized protein n=1 Tax=Streptomyces daliensis TaxID=299421 RepID=A0A8T4IKZ7_9ACTN|nr:hypothetical protein [Streptomyces daliensis]
MRTTRRHHYLCPLCGTGPRRHPLGALLRWGFVLGAVTAVAFDHLGAALTFGFLAWLAFKARPERRRRCW